jgi:hypothetical protein
MSGDQVIVLVACLLCLYTVPGMWSDVVDSCESDTGYDLALWYLNRNRRVYYYDPYRDRGE